MLLLVVPLRWLLAAAVAAGVHELSHILAVRMLGGDLLSLTVRPGGMTLVSTPLSTHGEILAGLAGPIGGMLLLLFVRRFPLTALCGTVHSLWNLLPVRHSDGQTVLRCCLRHYRNEQQVETICRRIELGCLVIGVIGMFLGYTRGLFR